MQSSTEDEAVRQAVASAGSGGIGPAGIAWADPETGTVGVITALQQVSAGADACRNFETSRHGYNGIALYIGRACRTADGPWRLIEFRPKQAPAKLAGGGHAATPAG